MILLDASPIIAMAQAGSLDLLRRIVQEAWTSDMVLAEAAPPGYPETDAILRALQAGWLHVEEVPLSDRPRFGLGDGEESLLRLAGEDDVLVFDDLPARRAARALGFRTTGVLGLLVLGVRRQRITSEEALATLSRLARSDFRMTVELYDRVRAMLG